MKDELCVILNMATLYQDDHLRSDAKVFLETLIDRQIKIELFGSQQHYQQLPSTIHTHTSYNTNLSDIRLDKHLPVLIESDEATINNYKNTIPTLRYNPRHYNADETIASFNELCPQRLKELANGKYFFM